MTGAENGKIRVILRLIRRVWLDGPLPLFYTASGPPERRGKAISAAQPANTSKFPGNCWAQGVTESRRSMELKSFIRDIPDFPEPGILFRDITPLLQNPVAFASAVNQLREHFNSSGFDVIVPVESRGFLFGAPMAYQMGKPLVPVRKPGKLPSATYSTEYHLEYGSNAMEIHVDGINPGQRVLILDDLLATGGTLAATARLVEKAGGIIAGIGVVIELTGLDGRTQLKGYDLFSLVQY